MAYVDPNNDPNSLSGGSNNEPSQPAQSGGSGFAGGGAQSKTNQPSNQFSNLQSLMNLNQHAPNTASNVNQNVQQGQQTQSQNANQATQNIGQAYNFDSKDMNNKIQGNDFSGLKQQLATTYQGPQAGTIDTGPSNLNQIDQQTKALGTQGGQQALLQQQYGRSDYSQGQQKLDNFLQGRNGQFQQDAAQARNQGAQLDQNVANQNQALNQQAGNTATQTAQGVNNLKTGLSGFNTNLQTTTNDLVNQNSAADQAVATQTAKMKADLANGLATQDTMNNLGYDPNQYTYGADLTGYISNTGGNGNFANTIGRDDANRFNNINQLLGDTSPALDLNTAGTYQKEATAYDKTGAQNAIQGGLNSYNAALAPQQQQVNDANNIYNLENVRNNGLAGTNGYNRDQAMQAIQQLQQNYGGSQGGDYGQQTGWAIANRQTQNQKFKQLQDQLSSQYMKKIGVES
jgi:hypothetical protein